MTEDLSMAMLDRLMFVLMKEDVPELDSIRNRFVVILNDYKVSPKEEALTVWTEGKNDYFLKRFLLAKAVAGCTKGTIKNYEKEIRRALNTIGKDADTISSVDIQVHLASIIRNSSKGYADNVRRDLSSFYSWMYREEIISKNPMTKVEQIKVRKKKQPAFSEMDVEKIRSACQNKMETAMVEVLLSTGCRVSELCSIKIDDLMDGVVNVLGKGDKYRNVYLNAKAQLAVAQYLEERSDSSPYLFPKSVPATTSAKIRSVKGNWFQHPDLVACDGPRDTGSVEAVIRKIGKRAGVDNCHPHRFRRTCATFALRRGMPIEQVSQMLGHEQLTTTQIYLDLSEEDLAQAHKKYVV